MLFRSSGFFATAFVVTVAMLSAVLPAQGADAPAKPAVAASAPAGGLDGRIQDVKGDVIKLNRDLLVLEEELLFPANTQVALFVSMDVGKLFSLDSVQVKLDDKVVLGHLANKDNVRVEPQPDKCIDALHVG